MYYQEKITPHTIFKIRLYYPYKAWIWIFGLVRHTSVLPDKFTVFNINHSRKLGVVVAIVYPWLIVSANSGCERSQHINRY